MQKHWIRAAAVATALAAAAHGAQAQGPGAVKKLAESSLLVKGHVVIAPDGSTAAVEIDKPEVLPKEIVGFVSGTVQGWKFKPIEHQGKEVRARAPMVLRVVAKKAEGDTYQVEIRSAIFGDEREQGGISANVMMPPRYPDSAVRSGVAGTVFLALRLDAAGKVIDVVPEQTNLRVAADERTMAQFRKTLERASVAAAKNWSFKMPLPDAAAGDVTATVRVPVAYSLAGPGMGKAGYGTWETYIPGPRNPIPWISREDMLAGSAGGADAVGDGTVQQLGRGPQLLTPLGPG